MTEGRELQVKFEGLRPTASSTSWPSRSRTSWSAAWPWARRPTRRFLTSEDWELLTTIASPVALAVENASLYKQAGVRTAELERLKDYSENIIESLTVGVAVLDTERPDHRLEPGPGGLLRPEEGRGPRRAPVGHPRPRGLRLALSRQTPRRTTTC